MRRASAVALALLILLVGLPAAAQRVQSNIVIIESDDVVDEDLYAAGNSIRISGRIEGDLVAAAFEDVRIEGTVTGDVIVLANRVEVTGRVEGALRVVARDLVVDGVVVDDVFTAAWDVSTGQRSEIGRDAVVFGRTVEALGSIERDLEGTHSTTRVGGSVGGDVDITTSDLSLLPGLDVAGDVVVVTDGEISRADDVAIGGSLLDRDVLAPNVRIRGIRAMARFLGLVAAVLLGLSILWSAPDRSLRAASALEGSPGRSAMWGVGLVSIPLATLIVVVAIVAGTSLVSTGPLLLILVPVTLATTSLVAVGLLAAPVPVALAIGGRLRPDWSSYAAFLTGFAALVVVSLVPWIGGWLVAALSALGLGSWIVTTDDA